ncbi:hypothetical protein [Thermocatellispora tengchongensis]|uniref:hypothetical protein n=1 Tax=Thermocatellispora tengchongensis TaxID=1073253 RepID=UPI00363491B5
MLTAANLMNVFAQSAYAIKPGDESVTNSITPQNDDHLFLPVEANTVYWLDAFIKADGAAAAEIQIGWTGPAGADLDWISDGLTTAATTGVDAVSRSLQGITNLPNVGLIGSGSNVVIPIRGVLTVAGTAGTLQFRWAQGVANATATRVRGGSVMRLTRMTP